MNETTQPAIDVAHLDRQRAWSYETFGPGDRLHGVIDHIERELEEVAVAAEAGEPTLPEWVDVVILALDGAWRSGASPEQIIAAVKAKQERNEGRTWPDWRTMPTDRAIEHDRSGEALQQRRDVPAGSGAQGAVEAELREMLADVTAELERVRAEAHERGVRRTAEGLRERNRADALQRQATRVRRHVESKAVTSRARGRADEERDWLDVLALLDAVEPAVEPAGVRPCCEHCQPDSGEETRYCDGAHRGPCAACRAAMDAVEPADQPGEAWCEHYAPAGECETCTPHDDQPHPTPEATVIVSVKAECREPSKFEAARRLGGVCGAKFFAHSTAEIEAWLIEHYALVHTTRQQDEAGS